MPNPEALARILAACPSHDIDHCKEAGSDDLITLILSLYWGTAKATEFTTADSVAKEAILHKKDRYTVTKYPWDTISPYCPAAESPFSPYSWNGVVRFNLMKRHTRSDVVLVVDPNSHSAEEKKVIFKGYQLPERYSTEPTGITTVGEELVLTTPAAFLHWHYFLAVHFAEGRLFDTKGFFLGLPEKVVPRFVTLVRPSTVTGEIKEALLKSLGKKPTPRFSFARLFDRGMHPIKLA